jgi:replicative superfamily II helicase
MVAKFFHILSLQDINTTQSYSSNRARRFKAVFLVPIKALVDQQYSAFKKVFIDQPESILKTIDTQVGER